VFSTGLSPALAAAAAAAVETASSSPSLRTTVESRAAQLRSGLIRLGIAPLGYGHIVPWVVGEPRRAMSLARALRDRRIHVQAIRPPSVPTGTARLRLTVSARHSEANITTTLDAIEDVLRSRAHCAQV
jgi:8-amino-7-oxononanoate synthase